MFTARIGTAQTSLFIEEQPGQSAELFYESDRPVAIWYRHNFYVWIRLVLDRAGSMPGLACRGAFRSSALLPGDILEYRIYEDMQHNPSQGDSNARGVVVPYDGLVLMGLRRRPRHGPWLHYSRAEALGTGCRFRLGTPATVSHVLIEISRDEPRPGSDGALRFTTPERAVFGFHRQFYQFDFKSLAPGSDYHVLIRCSDTAGNWWQEHQRFTMPEWPVLRPELQRRPAMVAGSRRHIAIPSNG
ncbi:hypothetical protein [Dongia sp.]|uniref:hypothetical protein n=1 Tax=Dongia sp. TaxID=1977262 RepID=UPI0035B2420E